MTPQQVMRRVFESAAGAYDWLTAQRAWRGSCAALAAKVPGTPARIADLGCGPGTSTFALAKQHPSATVLGIDVSERMLARARRQAHARGETRIAWIRTDAARLPLADESVDVVTGHSFLYLLPDRASVLAECLRVLRPGGWMVVMEPNERPLSTIAVLELNRTVRFLLSVALWRTVSRWNGRFTAASLDATLRGAGFGACAIEETLGGLGLLASAEKSSAGLTGFRSAQPSGTLAPGSAGRGPVRSPVEGQGW